MKRFYIKWTLAALAAMFMVLPVNGQEVRRLSSEQSTRTVNREGQKQILSFRQLWNRQGNVIGDGLVAAPTAEQNQHTILAERPAAMRHAPATRSAEEPRGNLYTVVPQFNGGTGYPDAFWGKIDMATGQVTRIHKGSVYCNNEDYDLQGGCVANGILYIPQYLQDMVTGEIEIIWKRVVIETGERLSNISFGAVMDAYFYGMAYHPEREAFYGLGMNLTNQTTGEFYEIDLKGSAPRITYLGNVGTTGNDFMAAITYCPRDKQLYGLSAEGNFYTLNPETGVKNIATQFDAMDSYYVFPSNGQPTCLAYSPLDNAFVTIYRDELNYKIHLAFIDFEDYSTTLGASMMNGNYDFVCYNASIHCMDQYADNNAPADCQLTSFNLNKAELSGSYTFKTPSTYYSGIALSGSEEMTVTVDMDGNVLETLTMTPGQSHTGNFTVTQGAHKLNIFASFPDPDTKDGVLAGPTYTRAFWAGNDHPNAPTNVKFVNNVVTWKAVGGTGENGGYVDTAAVTYDVFINNDKQNTEPITGTSFTCPVPDKMARRVLTVTASANNMTSPASAAQEIVNGKPLTLPVSLTPTQEQSTIFQNENVTNDPYYFQFYGKTVPYFMGLAITQYSDAPNDWLFLPQMHFDNPEMLYNIAFTYGNYYTTSDKHQSNIEVYIGKEPNSKSMTKLIYSRENANVLDPIDINTNFTVDEAGDYYIGFYTKVATSGQSRGIRLYNFNVAQLDTPTTVPGLPTDVKVEPADQGLLQADITLTLPTIDVMGRPLDANKDVTAYARVTSDLGDELTGQATGKPGQTVKFSCETFMDGFSFVLINTGNADGKGIERSHRVFTGFDVPGRPQNVRGVPSADNTYVDLYWDAPTVGLNGGYVDPNDITYEISLWGGAGNYNKVGQTKDTHYRFEVGATKLAYYYVGPAAVNRIGTSTMNTFYYDMLGTPHEMPMVETFQSVGGVAFEFGPWRYDAEGLHSNTVWAHSSSLNGLGIGDPVPNGALFYAQFLGDGGVREGELICPKVSTVGVDEPFLGLRYWDYEHAGTIQVYGRHAGQIEYEKLYDITPSRTTREWVDFSQKLPEGYQDCGWVQFRIRTQLTDSNISLCVLDEVKVYMDVENDFKASKISGPQFSWVGETPTFEGTILNTGMGTGMTKFAMELLGDGNVLLRNDFNTSRLSSNQSYVQRMSIDMKQDYLNYKQLQVRLRNLDQDEVGYNDERTMDITLVDCQYPTVQATAKWADDNHSAAVVEWNEPNLSYGTDENFEFETETFKLVDQIGPFQNIDLDKTIPFKFENRRFPNDDTECAWILVDHNELRTSSDERLSAHSGSKFLLARSAQFDEYGGGVPVQSDDWLISPEVVGDTEVSFWFNTVNSSYAETVELWYSTTGTNVAEGGATRDPQTGTYVCGDFKRIRPFTKVADEETWNYCTATLPADAKYFALVYCSYGQFGGCIDDISFTPKTLSSYELAGFDVWRRVNNDWSTYSLVGKDIKTNSFTDTTVGDNNAGYFVVTKVKRNGVTKSGARSDEAKLYSTLVDDLSQLEGVFGGHGLISVAGHEGETLALYNAEGKHLRQLVINSDRYQTEVEAGVYVVKAGNKIAKVVVR